MDVSHLLDGLNEDQRQAVGSPLGSALVLAGAGSGKTRVLVHRVAWLIQVEGASPHSILAVTFTNKAAAEMRSRIETLLGLPSGAMWLGTFHGLAHRLLRIHWREAGLPQSFQILDSEDQARVLRKVLKALELDETRWIPREILWFINAQKDEGHRPKHIKDDGDPTRRQLIKIYQAYEEACQRAGVVDFAELLLRAYELWRDNPALLQHYRTRFQHVLVDEFQDTNAIQYKWLMLLAKPDGMPFVVGDDDQCLAAGTQVTMGDGAKRSIESIVAGDFVLSNYGGGDLRPARVTECFAKRRQGQLVCLHLRSGAVIKSTPEHVHFAGYVLGETPQTYFLYLMHKEGVGFRLGTSQVYTQGQAKPMVGFKQRALQERADALWIVRTHSSENEARIDAVLTSLRFGLPTCPFVPRKGTSRNGFDTLVSAERLLEEVGLDIDRPHHQPQGRNSNRRNIVITLCGDTRGGTPMHRISVAGVSLKDRAVLAAMGLSVRAAKSHGGSWRYETVRADFGELMSIARSIRERLDGRFVLQGHMLEESLPFVTASSIRSGMVMAVDSGRFDVVERIERETCDAEVYDINVERTHNFVAGGVVTHNSIYRWRGARVENLNQFRRDFPQAVLYKLEQNYRSTGTILKAANALIANNAGRLGKTLWTSGEDGDRVKLYAAFNERDEADFVVNRIREWVARGGARREVAVLYRSNAQSRVFEEAFLNARMPYRVYGGLRFFERAEIKDALAYLRLVSSRADDTSFERVVNLPVRGIGAKTMDLVRDTARSNTTSLWNGAIACTQGALPQRAAQALQSFMELIDKLAREVNGLELHEQVDHVIQMSGLIEHYKKEKGERGEGRIENLLELVSAARGFSPETEAEAELSPLESFLAHAVLESGEGQADPYDDCVQMMTLHSAKGLEFPVVFLAGMEDGLFPHQRSVADLAGLEEERRLCYVGATRAMRQLYVTYAEQRRLYGVDTYGQPSRFIGELPPDLIEEIRPRLQVSRPVFIKRSSTLDETPAAGMRMGSRVRHSKFGDGVVLNFEGNGPHARIQVNFERQGTKWLMLSYANLEVV
ncbi:MAG TPA: UvrD-helicase domain-containing protein [Steroidobacteraceae bacterium]|jgi:DNA helicase-2/ATP-dependent DNA helicase PcrA